MRLNFEFLKFISRKRLSVDSVIIAPIEPVYLRYKSSILVVTALRLCLRATGSTTVFYSFYKVCNCQIAVAGVLSTNAS